MLPLFQLPHIHLESPVFSDVTATPLFTLIYIYIFSYSSIFYTIFFCLRKPAGQEKASLFILGLVGRHLGMDPDYADAGTSSLIDHNELL